MVDLTGLEFVLGVVVGWAAAGAVVLIGLVRHGRGFF